MADVIKMTTPERRRERLAEGLEFVVSNTTSFWAAEILTDLKAVGRSSDRNILSRVGLGLNFRVIGTFVPSGFVYVCVYVCARAGLVTVSDIEWDLQCTTFTVSRKDPSDGFEECSDHREN